MAIPTTAFRVAYDITYRVEYYPNHQATAGTSGNVLAISHVAEGNFEAIAARTRVVVDLKGLVIGAVFDFDLVVESDFFVGHGGGGCVKFEGVRVSLEKSGGGLAGN